MSECKFCGDAPCRCKLLETAAATIGADLSEQICAVCGDETSSYVVELTEKSTGGLMRILCEDCLESMEKEEDNGEEKQPCKGDGT